MYNDIQKIEDIIRRKKPTLQVNFINGPYVFLQDFPEDDYGVQMFSNGILIYETICRGNYWFTSYKKYFSNWKIVINGRKTDLRYEYNFNLEGKKVYIALESKSLGDTLAWFPYAEEFRKKWNCKVVVSTFMNELFIDQYPELEFIRPGESSEGVYASYKIGWFYNENGDFDSHRIPKDFKEMTMQETATSILGLDFKEVRAKLSIPKVEKKNKVGIGIHSTAQSKYWNNPNGWQEVVDYLKEKGYEVVLYSKEGDSYMGNYHPTGIQKFAGGSIQDVINDMADCQFFIGLGSGLSWLAWSVGLPVVLISGFSEEWAEMSDKTYRVINKSVCHGCFNRHRLNAGDWNWCPEHKGTERQFECTKTITSKMVIEQIEKLIVENRDSSVDIIVAKYKEDVSWTNQIKKSRIFIYDKGGENNNFIHLPNVGREAHTYLTHIIDNYDNISDYVCFLQGNPYPHSNIDLEFIENFNQNIDYYPLSNSISCDLDGMPHHPNLEIKKLVFDPFFIDIPDNIVFSIGALFIVSKKAILRRNRQFYIDLLKQFDRTDIDNSITGGAGNTPGNKMPWVMERVWPYIFSENFRTKYDI